MNTSRLRRLFISLNLISLAVSGLSSSLQARFYSVTLGYVVHIESN